MWPCRQFYLHYILALKHISQQVRNQVPGNLAVRVCKILKFHMNLCQCICCGKIKELPTVHVVNCFLGL